MIPARKAQDIGGQHSHTVVGSRALGTSLGGGSYTVGIALDGVGSALLDNLGGSLGNGIGVLDVVT